MLILMTATTENTVTVGGGRDSARWVMLVVLLCGQFMALLDATIVNVAMPTLGRSLHASGAELQLVIAGYTVSYAMLLITGARLGDLIGRRRMFMLGIGGFTLASLACGLAPDVGVLIAARFVQGAGAAAMMPQIMTVIQLRFSGPARARALSAYTAVLSSGFVAGQVIGGVLVTADLFGASWRPVFLVNVPIGLAVLLLLPRVMPADAPGRTRRLDLPGLLVAVPAVCLVVLPLMLGHQEKLARLVARLHRLRARAGARFPFHRTVRCLAWRAPAAVGVGVPRTGAAAGAGDDDAAHGHLRRVPVQLRDPPAGGAR